LDGYAYSDPVNSRDPSGLCPEGIGLGSFPPFTRQYNWAPPASGGLASPGLLDPVSFLAGGLAGVGSRLAGRASAMVGGLLGRFGGQRSTTTIWRAVNSQELASIRELNRFTVGAGSLEGGKWFWTSKEAAQELAGRMAGLSPGESFSIVRAQIPTDLFSTSIWRTNLDGIGDAIFAVLNSLDDIVIITIK